MTITRIVLIVTCALALAFPTALIILPGTAYAAAASPQAAASPAPLALNLLMRWTHVLSAVVMLGGSIFIRFILMPSASESLDLGTLQKLRMHIAPRWRRAVMILTVLFLVSGFYNYLLVTRFAHAGNPAYHMMFGIKFLLAMAVFVLAMVLVSSRARGPQFEAKRPVLMAVMIVLAVVVVMIGGYMKMMP